MVVVECFVVVDCEFFGDFEEVGFVVQGVCEFCVFQECFGGDVVDVEVDIILVFFFDDGGGEIELCVVNCSDVFVRICIKDDDVVVWYVLSLLF